MVFPEIHRGHLIVSLAGVTSVLAQSFVPEPQNVTSIQSTKYPGASISYKETHICDTTSGVNSYSGYVTVTVIDNAYEASIFFQGFGTLARNNSAEAPTTIYMPGGPGTSFLDGASGFPCVVNPDSNSTTLNEWSWNTNVNMLYLDMPVQTGYSYTEAKNGTFDTILKEFSALNDSIETVDSSQETFFATMSDQPQSRTANTTAQVAQQMWQISQVWFQEFPDWSTTNPEIDLWSYSYSGFFGPATVAYFQEQNELIANGSCPNENDIPLQLGTLGINNGCIDSEAQLSYWPAYALNNTYGIKPMPDEAYEIAMSNLTTCYELIHECRAVAAIYDPEGAGAVDEVNSACVEAVSLCFGVVQGIYTEVSNRSAFDITLPLPAVFPPEYNLAYYNQHWVQNALGVPVNFTLSADAVVNNFFTSTGDCMIVDKSYLEQVLNAGIGVAMVYGDRDYRCNWMGAENVSLSAEYPDATSFQKAGYAHIITNTTYEGGFVRQYGNFSFSRVFEAGHSVAAYQPETVFRIFERAIFGKDIATGEVSISQVSSYGTQGATDTLNVTNDIAEPVIEPLCFWYNAAETCNAEQQVALEKGVAVIEDYVVVSPAGTFSSTYGNPTGTMTGINTGTISTSVPAKRS